MRKEQTTGRILYMVGLFLFLVSEVADLGIIGVVGGIAFLIGLVMRVYDLLSLNREKQGNGISPRKKKWLIVCTTIVLILLFYVVLPFAKTEILSINAEEKLASFDLSRFDNVYCEGAPEVYDCKIFEYRKLEHATVFYVLGDCEFGVMVKLKWNAQDICWEMEDWRNMWSVHGGSASEIYWPPYYIDKMLPFG